MRAHDEYTKREHIDRVHKYRLENFALLFFLIFFIIIIRISSRFIDEKQFILSIAIVCKWNFLLRRKSIH